MAFHNNMPKLRNKAERRLGLRLIEPHLAKIDLGKSSWVEAVEEDSLPTYSRFFPKEVQYRVTNNTPHDDDGWYYIDEEFIENRTIIGIRDIDFRSFYDDSLTHLQDAGYGFITHQALYAGFTMEDIGDVQMAADVSSLFNQGIYPEFQAPNKFRLCSSTNTNLTLGLKAYNLILLIEHDSTLLTINPTLMEIFEELAFCDIANFLYQNLKYYDNLETIYATLDLKLDELQKWSEHREEVVNTLDDAHVSPSNPACPVMLTL